MAQTQTLVIFDDRTRSFRCAGCLDEPVEVPRRVMADQEQFVGLRESVEREHRECGQYTDARLARNARRVASRTRREMAALDNSQHRHAETISRANVRASAWPTIRG